MNKQGMTTWGLVVTIVLFLIVALAAGMLYASSLKGAIDKFTDREVCRLSVQNHMAFLIEGAGVDVVDAFDIDCSSRVLEVYDDHVERGGERLAFYDGKNDKTIEKYDTLTPDIVNALVADEMSGCWYQFLEGKADFLGSQFEDVGNNERRCFICTELQFDDALSVTNTQAIKDYLREAKVYKQFMLQHNDVHVHDYLFNDETLCGSRYDDWENWVGEDVLADDATCAERYLAFWSPAGLLGPRFLNTRTSDRGLDFGIDPFIDQNITISPEQGRYFILYMVEGGSWLEDSPLATVWDWLGRDAEKWGKPTHAMWIVPSSELNTATCDGYFA